MSNYNVVVGSVDLKCEVKVSWFRSHEMYLRVTMVCHLGCYYSSQVWYLGIHNEFHPRNKFDICRLLRFTDCERYSSMACFHITLRQFVWEWNRVEWLLLMRLWKKLDSRNRKWAALIRNWHYSLQCRESEICTWIAYMWILFSLHPLSREGRLQYKIFNWE
jgi:hypothetical protein